MDTEPLPAMETQTIYLVFRRCLEVTHAHPTVRGLLGPQAKVPRGAAIIRNAVILDWVAAAAQLEGHKSVESLRSITQGTSSAKPALAEAGE